FKQPQGQLERSAHVVARLMAEIKAITDCQQGVVGGSVGMAAGYLERIRKYLAWEPSVYHVTLSTAHYRLDAGLLGAA
ncbi:ROK family protein, partial [Enterobacter hormaechei]|uniref:ROK family protein n=1 Tax=Enterobacter hormaechei TaxID=158836 RepID=UPI002040DE85